MKKLFITLAMLPMLAFAGQDGSGGGGICVNNKCKTLAEAGFRTLADAGTRVEVSVDVIQEVLKIASLLPNLLNGANVIGQPGDIEFVTAATPSAVKKFLAEYRTVLSDNGGQTYSDKLEIFGFTVRTKDYRYKTYILMDKYEKLSLRGKALLLIHESQLRQGRSLAQTLTLDGVVVDYLAAKESNNWENFDTWSFLRRAGYDSQHLVADLVYRMGGVVDLELLVKDWGNGNDGRILEVSYIKAIENNQYDSRFSTYVGPFRFVTKNYDERIHFIFSILRSLTDEKTKSITVTKLAFANAINKYLIENPFKKDAVNALSKCGKDNDKRLFLYSKRIQDIIQLPGVVDCIIPDHISSANPLLYAHLDGINFNLPGKLVCTYVNGNVGYKCSQQ